MPGQVTEPPPGGGGPARIPRSRERVTLEATMRLQLPLPALSAATRAAGALSRLAGSGRRDDLARQAPLEARSRRRSRGSRRGFPGSAALSATNGKTTTAAMTAEILGGPRTPRAQPLGGEPRLRDRLHPPRRRRRRARPVRGGRGCAPAGRLARAAARALPRQPLPRPARPLRRARADRRALAHARPRASRRRDAGRER